MWRSESKALTMLHEGARNRCQHHWGDTPHITHGRVRARERQLTRAYTAGAAQEDLDVLEASLHQADRRVPVYDRCGPYGLFAGTYTWVKAYAQKHPDLDTAQLQAKLFAELGDSERSWLAKQAIPEVLAPRNYAVRISEPEVVLDYEVIRQYLDEAGLQLLPCYSSLR